jgi:hypothetical protein
MAITTTAIAQPGWWVGCNPEAYGCAFLSGGADPRLAPRYVAPTPTYPEACTCTCHDTAPARTERARTAAIRGDCVTGQTRHPLELQG